MKPMKYFEINELLSPEITQILSLEACWMLIPHHVRYGLDKLRELYGATIVINNNNYKNSGVRTQNCTVGATYSAHKCNRGLIAFDLKVSDLQKLRSIVSTHYKDLRIHETESEEFSKTWCHIAFGESVPSELRIIQP